MRRILAPAGLALLVFSSTGCGGSAGAAAGPDVPYRFMLEIDGVQSAVRSVDGLKVETEVVEYTDPSGPIRKRPGRTKWGNIVLNRSYVVPVTPDPVVQWYRDTIAGQDVRKNITVIILRGDNSEAKRYNYLDCFPTAYSLTPLDAGSRDSPLQEGVTIAVHRADLP